MTHKEEIDIPDGWTYTPQSGQTEDPGLRTLSIVLYRIPMPKPEIGTKLETLNQNVNLLIQDVRDIQKKVDSLIPTVSVPSVFGPCGPQPEMKMTVFIPPQVKSYAEKEYSDMTIAELRREQDKPIDKEPKEEKP